ncbi:YibE/F family protein [uncultured Desulfobacter sp.]|uniref:YibE/F family protein n=1 Tax=uncultured Desulfobacter sp. TaxID=240139 RepID=UPI002AAAA196|nr:YibE/F family protein [uncultured Desulfobacter sp.]
MNKSFVLSILILSALMAAMFYYFMAREPALAPFTLESRARVISVDDSEVHTSGLSHLGFQTLEIEILNTRFKGVKTQASNSLNGQIDLENLYHVNDTIIAAIIMDKDGSIEHVKAVDLYRQNSLLSMFIVFTIALLLYAGAVGVKALISFILSIFIIWEILVKQILAGHPPLITTTFTLILLSAIIIFMVAGVNRKGLTAFLGTIAGLGVTLFATLVFGKNAGLLGMTQPYVNTLIFSGYYNLDIRQIFYSAIVLGASGAAMDIAMDIAASMDEIRIKKPDISARELMKSGFTVGRQVIGTMTTTLLLAYSGGYLTLLMIFRVKDPSFVRMINLKIVSAEIMRTLIGSIGLVMVAPITALLGGVIIAGLTTHARK